MADTKWSQFPSATPGNSDDVVGLHSGDNARFSVANFVFAIRQGLTNIFVPQTRTINNKSLSSDITLTMDDISNGTTYAKTTAAQVTQIGTNEEDIDTIEGKIPSAASTTNQLADKAFVTDAITQGTAIFRGSFASKAALLAVAWQTTNPDAPYFVSNNDYAVVLDDETQSDECWRYIYVTGTGWTPQYKINESPMTQAQLDALNSGATAAIISSVADKLDKTGNGKDVTATFTAASTRTNISTGEKLSVLFGKIAKWFSDLGTAAFRAATGSITSGSTALVESGAVYTGLAGKQNKITASGILKSDGQGGVTAATAGTDYGTYSKPSGGIPASDLANGVIPTVPSAYTSNPAMDGMANPGSSGAWAKGDHVHPSDTSRVPVYGLGKNLLDNAYFVGGGSQLGDGILPINQRGQTQYTGNINCIDRWNCYTGLDIHSDGVDFSQIMPAQYAPSLSQNLEKVRLVPGLSYALSTLWSDGTFWANSGVLQNSTGWQIESGSVNANGCAIRSRNANYWQVAIWNTDTSRRLVAAKLEFGIEQTLAHQENGVWVLNEIPDFETEWNKCNKYLRVYYRDSTLSKSRMLGVRFSHESRAGYAMFAVPIDPPMASAPTVTNNSALAMRTITGSNNIANVTFSFSNTIRNVINIRADSTNITAGTLYWIDTLTAGNKMIVSAEI